jgi:TRAP-type uncharacterized transport system fused permease subunit
MNILESIKTYLSSLACVIGVILVFLTDLIKPPSIPDNFPETLSNIEGSIKFIIGSVLLILIFPLSRYSDKKFQLIWWIISVVCLIGAIISFYLYANFTQKVIVYDEPNQTQIIIGYIYTPYTQIAIDSIKAKDSHQLITPNFLLYQLAGDGGPNDIWTNESIFENCKKYFLIYAVTIFFLVLFLLTALQGSFGLQIKK